jgi:hypothetical protein
VVEVAELDAPKLALTNTTLEQQVEREPVASVGLRQNRRFLILREDGALDAAFLRRPDRTHRVATQLLVQHRPLEESFE